MITDWRKTFNARYEEAAYQALLNTLKRATGAPVPFRIAETPCFFPKSVLDHLGEIGGVLTQQLLEQPGYLSDALQAIPEQFRLASSTAHPHFLTVDFGFVRHQDGSLSPRLVEMQAFPSVYAFQVQLAEAYRQAYALGEELSCYLGGHTRESFRELFRQVVVGPHDPEEVVLAELHPQQQKTLPDFVLTSSMLGIPLVDAMYLVTRKEQGQTSLYFEGARGLQRVRRIYNRVIVDELVQRQVKLPYDYRDDLDVEWAGHPNWYFLISKFSIPYLRHPSVPEAVFLDDWFQGAGSAGLHGDREEVLLKPLFSFAGKGILFAPTDQDLQSVPVERRRAYLMQQRVPFAPIIDTPYGPTQAEVRILYLWPDGGTLQPVLPLVRLGRGRMMGVDQNRDQRWVGATTAFWPIG